VVTIVAGNGSGGSACYGGLAINANLSHPNGLALDSAGNLFIDDVCDAASASLIHKLTGTSISVAAGGGSDVGPPPVTGESAAAHAFNNSAGLATDGFGNVYVAETGTDYVTWFNPAGTIYTLTNTSLYNGPFGVAVDSARNVYVADTGNSRICKAAQSGCSPLAVTGLSFPKGVAVDSTGNLYIADTVNSLIRKLDTSGNVTKVAGGGTQGTADGVPASQAQMNNPVGIAADYIGNLYVADTSNGLIRKVDTLGYINTIAGGSAAGMQLSLPAAVAVGPAGEVYVADTGNNRVLKLTPPGLLFVPIPPCNVLDTRGSPIAAGSSRDVPILQGPCGVPNSAEAYSLNVTLFPPPPLPSPQRLLWPISVYVSPTGQRAPGGGPTVASLYGRAEANSAIVPAGANGSVTVFPDNVPANQSTDVTVTINGYFVPPPSAGALAFYPITPCRAVDTNLSAGVLSSFTIPTISSSCAVAQAPAYSFHIAVVPKGTLGSLTAWQNGQPQPAIATLTSPVGTEVGTEAIVPADASGTVNFSASDDTEMIIDVNGYFAPPGSPGQTLFHPVAPCWVVVSTTLFVSLVMNLPVPASPCDIPATAQAYLLNMTAYPVGNWPRGGAGPPFFITAWPANPNASQPDVYSLNTLAGDVVANTAIVAAGQDNQISLASTSATNLLLDTSGYFAP
jgi:sugar lactone lactonase YvrE